MLLLCCCVLYMGSCRSSLYRAAEQGDVVQVRQALAAGALEKGEPTVVNAMWQYPAKVLLASVDILMGACSLGLYAEPHLVRWVEKFDKSPADAAWQHGHMGVLEALAEAGVAIAPESMRGRALLLQEDCYGSEGKAESAAVFAEVGNENVADCFVRYWSEEDDWTKHRGIYLKHCVWEHSDTRGRMVLYPIGTRREKMGIESPEMLCYRRTGVRSAEVTMRGFSSVAVASKYELNFETPVSGTYRHLYADSRGVVRQFSGRFWVR